MAEMGRPRKANFDCAASLRIVPVVTGSRGGAKPSATGVIERVSHPVGQMKKIVTVRAALFGLLLHAIFDFG